MGAVRQNASYPDRLGEGTTPVGLRARLPKRQRSRQRTGFQGAAGQVARS